MMAQHKQSVAPSRLLAAALLRAQFDAAVAHLKSSSSGGSSDNTTKLKLYALFKFIHHGPCSDPEPSSFDFTKHAKW